MVEGLKRIQMNELLLNSAVQRRVRLVIGTDVCFSFQSFVVRNARILWSYHVLCAMIEKRAAAMAAAMAAIGDRPAPDAAMSRCQCTTGIVGEIAVSGIRHSFPPILLPTALREITRTTPATIKRSSMGKACKLCGLVALQ